MSAKQTIQEGKAILGIEYVKINKDTTISEFKHNLQMNEVYYMLNKALK